MPKKSKPEVVTWGVATQLAFSVERTILRQTLLVAISPRSSRFHPRERGAVSRGT